MRRFTTARWYLAVLIPLVIGSIVAGCTDDTPTNNTPTIGDTARGAYLVKYVAGCGDCHTPTDQTGAPIAGKTLAGGYRFGLGPLGAVYSANITPDSTTGIGAMTDAQIIAAIRTGISEHMENGTLMKDTLVVMPYQNYAYLTDDDVKAIVAFLRYEVAPVKNQVPEDSVSIHPLLPPQPGYPAPSPDNVTTKQGKYLVTIGGCNDCHTPGAQSGSPDMTKFLSGGEIFTLPFGTVYSLNITSDDSTGIGTWTDAQINTALTTGVDDEGEHLCPPMPWQVYKGMTQADRDALIAYLRGIPKIVNKVQTKTALCN